MNKPELLVAIDLTDESEEILTAARRLADALDGNLHSTTVVQPLTGLLGNYNFVPAEQGMLTFEDDAMQAADQKLKDLSEQFDIGPGHAHTRLGKPSQEIRNLAAELEAEIVIIGNHRRHGVERFLGSTATAVLSDVTYDTMVVNIHPMPDPDD